MKLDPLIEFRSAERDVQVTKQIDVPLNFRQRLQLGGELFELLQICPLQSTLMIHFISSVACILKIDETSLRHLDTLV